MLKEILIFDSATVHLYFIYLINLVMMYSICRACFASVLDYDKAEALGREYTRASQGGLAEVPNSVARPNDHPFFMRLRPELVRVYDKLQRENDLM